MGDHSYRAADYPPGTVIGPNGEPFGPNVNPGLADAFGPASQDVGYTEAEDLQPDLSQWDADVVAVR